MCMTSTGAVVDLMLKEGAVVLDPKKGNVTSPGDAERRFVDYCQSLSAGRTGM